MHKKPLLNYLSDDTHRHTHVMATFLGFLFLSFETVFSGTTATYSGGDVVFTMSLSILKIISVFIYLSSAGLIAVSAGYKRLLVPDFVLLAVKLYTVITDIISLWRIQSLSLLSELSIIESIVEGLLFSAFLITLFIGKLRKSKNDPSVRKSPYICLIMLALCFPFTVVFEVCKLITALGTYHQHTFVAIFNFIRGVVNEVFLDLPYALLILLIYFVPEKSVTLFKLHKNHGNR